MAKSEFVNYVLDLLSPYGSIKARAMFGGYGVYKDSLIVGIIVDDELYFKVDTQSSELYKSMGSRPFCYRARDKVVNMSYWLVLPEIIENEMLLESYLHKAYMVSLKSKSLKN